ncbi:MAG: helix-turn-helix transcriptional regulator [Oscillospiraceae bacterium]|nr:helix-turn-helix transcriptional regulator [Oscillospiraceae bacterium]
MKSLELKAERVRRGYTQEQIAKELGVSVAVYCLKENGKTAFTDAQKLALINFLGLTLQETNNIFYDGELPSGAISK